MSRNWLGHPYTCVCGKTVHRDTRTNTIVDHETGWTHKCTFMHDHEGETATRPDPRMDEVIEAVARLAESVQRLVDLAAAESTERIAYYQRAKAVKR